MHIIRLTLNTADLAQVMSSMRCRLDENHIEPLAFIAEKAGSGRIRVKLDFFLGNEAERFAAAFEPPQKARDAKSCVVRCGSMRAAGRFAGRSGSCHAGGRRPSRPSDLQGDRS